MKNKIISLLLAMSVLLTVCGCGEKEPVTPDSSAATQIETPSESSTVAAESTEEPVINQEITFVEAFLCNEIKASVDDSSADMYTLGEIIELHSKELEESYMPYFFEEAYWAEIDCGMDGEKEIAVKVIYSSPETPYDTYEENMVFCRDKDNLRLVSNFESYYRIYTSMNYAGYIQYGGSTSAISHAADYYFINGDGQLTYLYSLEETFIGKDGRIPFFSLPGYHYEMPEWYDYDWDGEGGYLDCYMFELYDGTEDYDAYCDRAKYTITDEDNTDITLDAEYAAYYKEIGMDIISAAEAEKLVAEKMAVNGLTKEVIDVGGPEWILIDF